MTHRLVLFKWIETEEKILLDIIEEPFENLEKATSYLDTVPMVKYDLAKIFFGDALVHTRDQRKLHHCQNFS